MITFGPGFTQAQASVAVSTTCLCVNGASSWTGSDPLDDRDRAYTICNNGSETDLYLAYIPKDAKVASSVASTNCIAVLSPTDTRTFAVPRNYKLVVVRSASSDARSTNATFVVGA